LLDRGALDHRAQGLRGPPAAADDAAVVVRADRQLEDDRSVILANLGDLDLVGLVDEATGEVLQEILHRLLRARRCPACAGSCEPIRWAGRRAPASREPAPR